jgi:hypothetical protein
VGLGINPKSEKDFSLGGYSSRVKKICNGFDLHPKEDCQISEFGNPQEVILRRGRRREAEPR